MKGRWCWTTRTCLQRWILWRRRRSPIRRRRARARRRNRRPSPRRLRPQCFGPRRRWTPSPGPTSTTRTTTITTPPRRRPNRCGAFLNLITVRRTNMGILRCGDFVCFCYLSVFLTVWMDNVVLEFDCFFLLLRDIPVFSFRGWL